MFLSFSRLFARFGAVCFLVTGFSFPAWAQQATVASVQGASLLPTVRFTKEQAALSPCKYTVEINDAGEVRYQSWDAKDSEEPYTIEFVASGETARKIFELSRNTNYFQGSFDYTAHRIANMGSKTLGYRDRTKNTETKYNWSENAGIQNLTNLFEGISSVLESGQRIEMKRRFDPLGLDAELKIVEDAMKKGEIPELHAIASVLQKVADDPQVMNIARERARRLLEESKVTQPG